MGNRRYAYTRAAKTLVPNHVASKNALNKIDGLIDLIRSLILIDLSRVEPVDAVENLCCAEAQNRIQLDKYHFMCTTRNIATQNDAKCSSKTLADHTNKIQQEVCSGNCGNAGRTRERKVLAPENIEMR